MNIQRTNRKKKACESDAQLRAKAIVELSEDLANVVKREAALIICDEINRVICELQGTLNRLSVISAGYRAGSLPPQIREEV